MKGYLCLLLVSAVAAYLDPLSDEFLDRINSRETTWKAGRNFPEGTAMDTLRRLVGVLSDPEGFQLPLRESKIPEAFEIPFSFDAREQWPDCPSIFEIRDQGNCGSCWAVAAVSVMSDRACIHSQGQENFRYSDENLLACCNTCGLGCNGGLLSPAFNYWVNHGIVSGGTYGSNEGCQSYSIPPSGYYKYTPTPDCQLQCHPDHGVNYEDDLRFGLTAYRLYPNVTEIQYEVMINGPVEVSFHVFEDFYSYTSGVYQHVEGSFTGEHAVRLIGWGEEAGTPYWLIANSWNATWGDNGYFKILRGVNECLIEINPHGGIPKPLA
ncbi:hypothetical protein SK128_018896 [Halocaridina rubra]|uniref:Peptidase C1A papain C-terminal domain-containing protein n=1 Tax=Halocaridina rubra TaxID=373956 RepID=A0AAN9A1U7_HALRR